jgi:hypothetical protein
MPQVPIQKYLRWIEQDHGLYFWDIEASGLNADYAQILVITIKPYGLDPVTFKLAKGHSDKSMCRRAAEMLSEADAWCTYYGKGYDVKMLNTRLLYWDLPLLVKQPHIDMFYVLKYFMKTGSKSQAHLLNFLELPEEKMTVHPSAWSQLSVNFTENMETLVKRCESDCVGLEALYDKTKAAIQDARR